MAMITDRDLVLALVSSHPHLFPHLAPAFSNDDDFVMSLAAVNGAVLEHLGDALKANKLVVLSCVTQCGDALRFAAAECHADAMIALAAIRSTAVATKHVSPELLASVDFRNTLLSEKLYKAVAHILTRPGDDVFWASKLLDHGLGLLTSLDPSLQGVVMQLCISKVSYLILFANPGQDGVQVLMDSLATLYGFIDHMPLQQDRRTDMLRQRRAQRNEVWPRIAGMIKDEAELAAEIHNLGDALERQDLEIKLAKKRKGLSDAQEAALKAKLDATKSDFETLCLRQRTLNNDLSGAIDLCPEVAVLSQNQTLRAHAAMAAERLFDMA